GEQVQLHERAAVEASQLDASLEGLPGFLGRVVAHGSRRSLAVGGGVLPGHPDLGIEVRLPAGRNAAGLRGRERDGDGSRLVGKIFRRRARAGAGNENEEGKEGRNTHGGSSPTCGYRWPDRLGPWKEEEEERPARAGPTSRFPGRKTRGSFAARGRARSPQARGCTAARKPRSATGRGTGNRRARRRPWCGSAKAPAPTPRRRERRWLPPGPRRRQKRRGPPRCTARPR